MINKVDELKKKPKKIKQNKSFKAVKTTINGYGFEYSLSKFMGTLSLFSLGIITAGYLFRLTWYHIGIIMMVALFFTPIIIVAQYRYIYNQNQFMQLVTYMESTSLAFIQRPKILDALKEAKRTASGKMLEAITESIEGLTAGESYESVLQPIEKDFGCGPLYSLHRYLINVETKGGKYREMLTALIDSNAQWQERTYLFQIDRRKAKKTTYISIISCCILCGIGLFMSGKMQGVRIDTNIAYQFSTTLVLCIFLTIVALIESRMNGSWLTKSHLKDIRKTYTEIESFNTQKEKQKVVKKCLLFIPFLLIGVFIGNIGIILAVLILSLLVFAQPFIKHRSSKKTIEREIEKEFSDWMRSVALDIEKENVQVALIQSFPNAPEVMKPELQKLIARIQIDTTTIDPYLQFMENFNLPDINRTMKIIYSISGLGSGESQKMLENLISQNDRVAEKGEKYDMEDQLLALKNIMFLPPIITMMKLAVDIFLIFSGFLAVTGKYLS